MAINSTNKQIRLRVGGILKKDNNSLMQFNNK